MRYIFFLLVSAFLFASCKDFGPKPINNIIPIPMEVTGFERYSNLLNNINLRATDAIEYKLIPTMEVEEYIVDISDDGITISSKDNIGQQRAISTIQQMQDQNEGKLPLCTIRDKPRFKYRGMHLDVARHFFSVKEVKKYIDYLAYYKFNTFHWHLTDDQGWRIEIKRYPKLQEIAAFRKETLLGHYNDQPQTFDGKKYGGYYTQEEIKQVVNYAKDRGIEVIPEIEMPGHALAALSAYPELGCTSGPFEAATKWGVFNDVFCPYDTTFKFLQNVIDEVITLFPSDYIHIGGDECPKTSWENSEFCQNLITTENLKDEHGLQSYFITRMEKYINSKGKKIIGWDEILEGGLAPNATVMSWRGVDGGIAAANLDHQVIMSPMTHCYFDYYQSEKPDEPLAIGGYIPVEKVYKWNPIPDDFPTEKHQFILGGQGNVWTEYLEEFSSVEYMALNRMIALSEVLWSATDTSRTFEVFKPRLANHLAIWKNKKVNIANHLMDVKANVFNDAEKGSYLKFSANEQIMFSKNGSDFKAIPTTEFTFEDVGTYQFYMQDGKTIGATTKISYEPHLATKAKLVLENKPSKKYAGNGPRSLINGVVGSSEKYGDTEWLGFYGTDCVATITFDQAIDIHQMTFRFFNGPGQWIYPPELIEIMPDNGKLITLGDFEAESKVLKVSTSFEGENIKKLKIRIRNHGTIAEGQQGAGNPSWLFVDEITIK